jgi:hypothetical protein
MMQPLSVFGVRGGVFMMLMIALAVLAAPTLGIADMPDAHAEGAVVADSHGVIAGKAAHDDAVGRSCHPDPTCSPVAILMTRPIFVAQDFSAAGQPLAKTTLSGRNAPVDLPPPRRWAVPRSNNLNDTQT